MLHISCIVDLVLSPCVSYHRKSINRIAPLQYANRPELAFANSYLPPVI